jgi:hypothetical protein
MLAIYSADQGAIKSGGAPPHSKTWPALQRTIIRLAFWSAPLLRCFSMSDYICRTTRKHSGLLAAQPMRPPYNSAERGTKGLKL